MLQEPANPAPLITVVDIGANPIDGSPPYAKMLAEGKCQLIGFEPQADAMKNLQETQGPHEKYLPYAIGDGKRHKLYLCAAPGMTSLFEPDPEMLSLLDQFASWGEVVRTEVVETVRLDDADIEEFDFLKIDVQGSELMIFQNGRHALRNVVVIQTEVSFIPLYKKQPLFCEVEAELRSQGFVPHKFEKIKMWNRAGKTDPEQLLEADIVYVRDFSKMEKMTSTQLQKLATIVTECYGSTYLSNLCLAELKRRGSDRIA